MRAHITEVAYIAGHGETFLIPSLEVLPRLAPRLPTYRVGQQYSPVLVHCGLYVTFPHTIDTLDCRPKAENIVHTYAAPHGAEIQADVAVVCLGAARDQWSMNVGGPFGPGPLIGRRPVPLQRLYGHRYYTAGLTGPS